MTQALQFTVDQVAKQLDLSESVVNRLSQYFMLPASYYQVPYGQPRLHLYQVHEVDILRQVQNMLVSGMSLAEIKDAMSRQPIAQLASAAADDWQDDDGDWEADTEDEESLQEYEQNEWLKEQLAQVTFKQYRLKNTTQKPPFKALVETLEAQRRILGSTDDIVMSSSAAGYLENTQIENLEPVMAESPFSQPYVHYSWITPDLQARALSLRQELLRRI